MDRGGRQRYEQAVAAAAAQYRSLGPGVPVRLSKRTSNLFRTRSAAGGPGLDLSAFDGVIEVDPVARVADVGGLTTYERLVDATLAHGLMPLVVPELKTITLGGAITGLGIESSSWRAGMPHESMLELDVLTGDGRVVTATPDGPDAALFSGFPNSYGTLGYALRIRIELEPVEPWVHLRHLRFGDAASLIEVLGAVCSTGVHGDEPVDFVDGTVFSPSECYLTLGSWASTPPPQVSDYTGADIYYRSIQTCSEDWLTTLGYLWRWDTDWFWCSRAFGVQRRWVRQLLGPRWLRSDTYWRLVSLDSRLGASAALRRLRGRPPLESVIQDVEVPVTRLDEFLADFAAAVPISPLWLCPLRQRNRDRTWPLYRLDPEQLYVNVGFWSRCPLEPGMAPDHHNRWVEDEVERLGGRKSLYSTAGYDPERFWRLYNGDAYHDLKQRYDPDHRLLDLYHKCVLAR
jgi:FAD/FMN-containing dehydrogenase